VNITGDNRRVQHTNKVTQKDTNNMTHTICTNVTVQYTHLECGEARAQLMQDGDDKVDKVRLGRGHNDGIQRRHRALLRLRVRVCKQQHTDHNRDETHTHTEER